MFQMCCPCCLCPAENRMKAGRHGDGSAGHSAAQRLSESPGVCHGVSGLRLGQEWRGRNQTDLSEVLCVCVCTCVCVCVCVCLSDLYSMIHFMMGFLSPHMTFFSSLPSPSP